MKSLFAFSAAATILGIIFTGCEKDEQVILESSPTSLLIENYAPLDVGNYWVYQNVVKNSTTGESNYLNQLDTLRVTEEMLIDGQIFYKMSGTLFGTPFQRILRHENNRLVSSSGNIFLSMEDLPDTINISYTPTNWMVDSIYTVIKNNPVEIDIPYGIILSEYQYDRIFYTLDGIKHETEFYSKNIGVILYSTFYSGTISQEMQLIDYFITE